MLGFTPHGHGQVEHCLGNQNPRADAVLMEVRVSAAGAGPVGLNPVCHGQLLVAFMCADLILMMKCWLPPCWASHQGAIIILYLKVNILVTKKLNIILSIMQNRLFQTKQLTQGAIYILNVFNRIHLVNFASHLIFYGPFLQPN